MRSGSGSSPRLTAATAVSPSRRQREFKLSPEMEEVVELRAAFAARMPAAEAVQRSAVSIIVCGATCLSHWDQVRCLPVFLFGTANRKL